MPQYYPLRLSDMERHVLDAEAAADALLETPRLQPASLSNLAELAELITEALRALETGGDDDTPEVAQLRDLRVRTLNVVKRLSAQ
ncbi:MAG: hypothetical protein EON58_07445 [Alphaproteobacteria bacterium]|nr:MAG: hypothetical protein EON58_07445 [Alphaproteobacteria bacterium]